MPSEPITDLLSVSTPAAAAGVGLSLVAAGSLVAAILGVWRTTSFEVPFFGVVVEGIRARRVWTGLLVVGFVAGFWGMPVWSTTTTQTGPAEPSELTAQVVSSSIWLPCYRITRVRSRTAKGVVASTRTRRVLILPWPFLLALGLCVYSLRAAETEGRQNRTDRDP